MFPFRPAVNLDGIGFSDKHIPKGASTFWVKVASPRRHARVGMKGPAEQC